MWVFLFPCVQKPNRANSTTCWWTLVTAAAGNLASGVVGEAEELHSAGLPVVVVLALLVIAGVGQQRALGVPRHGEGGRVALHLPQLLPCRHTVPPLVTRNSRVSLKNQGSKILNSKLKISLSDAVGGIWIFADPGTIFNLAGSKLAVPFFQPFDNISGILYVTTEDS